MAGCPARSATQIVPLRVVDPDLLDHLAAAQPRLEPLQHSRRPYRTPIPVGPSILCAERHRVASNRRDVESEMGGRLGAIEQDEGSRLVGPTGHRSVTGLIVPRTFETWARATSGCTREQATEGVQVQHPLAHHGNGLRSPRLAPGRSSATG